MKKFLSLLMMTLLCVTAWAEESVTKTLTFTSETMQSEISSYTDTWKTVVNGDSWTLTNFNNNKRAWSYVKCGRKNNASVGTITTDEAIEAMVTRVVVTVDAVVADKVNSTKLEVATDAEFTTNLQTITATIGTGAVEYSIPTPTANCYYRLTYDCASHTANGIVTISKVEYYASETAITVAKPVIAFSPATAYAGDQVTVNITCATEGATIRYAINDGEYQDYTEPFVVTENATIKAIATKGNDTSEVAEKAITFGPSVNSVAEFNALADNTQLKFNGNVTVVGQYNSYLYVQDNEKGMLIYGYNQPTYNFGDIIPAGFTGKKTTFNGAPEMANPAGLAEATGNAQPNPIAITPAQVNLDNFGRYAVINGATISNGNINVGEESVALYDRFKKATVPTDGGTYDIYGVVGYFNGEQFMPLEYVKVEKKPIVITFDPNGGTFDEPVVVKINTENLPEGAVVKYSVLDEDEEFVVNDAEYSENGVLMSENGFIWAYVYDANNSYLADEMSEDFIFNIHIPSPVITVTPDFGEYEDAQTVFVTVENKPADAVIEYYFVEDEPATGAPRRAEGDAVWSQYDETTGIAVEKSGLLTIRVNDATGLELASIEGNYIIKNTVTGIEVIEANDAQSGARYNVAGQRVSKDYKGIVIVNGKKAIK